MEVLFAPEARSPKFHITLVGVLMMLQLTTAVLFIDDKLGIPINWRFY